MYERERGMEGEVAEWQRAQRAALCLGESSGLAMGSKETGVWLFSGMDGWDGDGHE
jgi:hypothetical protein